LFIPKFFAWDGANVRFDLFGIGEIRAWFTVLVLQYTGFGPGLAWRYQNSTSFYDEAGIGMGLDWIDTAAVTAYGAYLPI